MQIPPLDRSPNLRTVAAELASMAVAQVIPVAPVNPSSNAVSPAEPSPSVINMVGKGSNATATQKGEGVYASVSDPARRGSEAATISKDWTIHRPASEKVEDPPPPPMSKVLMDHIKLLWTASASAVQVQQEVRNHIDPNKQNLNAVPGTLAAESLTYSPNKINKTENI
jgi:hypothetical protein